MSSVFDGFFTTYLPMVNPLAVDFLVVVDFFDEVVDFFEVVVVVVEAVLFVAAL